MAATTLTTAITPEEQESLKASVFQRLHPRVYLERFLAEKVRPDGRNFDEWRDISVNVGSISTADGSALVRLGQTTIVCGVKAEIAEPELDQPGHGFLVPNLDLPAICSSKFKPGPPSEEAQVLSDRLNDALVASGILSLSSLCIQASKAVWVLYVDAMCINYDGNAFDAALMAMVAALKNTTLPKATYDEQTGQTTCSRTIKEPLQISRIPLAVSFGIFDSKHILSDPTAFEEPLLDTTISVVVADGGEVISASQLGLGIAGPQDPLVSCISAAQARRPELATHI
ncbi:ribosomal protein S5 domain 2-like protein [Infundibulicybe gibba]|nr:ribosomal protein S5 domain 2-like protein [Infundibulicybe gibba]